MEHFIYTGNQKCLKWVVIVTMTLLFTSLFGCNDKFMELYPMDQLSSETFWNSEAELKMYNNSIYDMSYDRTEPCINVGHGNSSWYGHNKSILLFDGYSDNFLLDPRGGDVVEYNNIRHGKQVPQSGLRFFDYGDFGLLREINFGLANYFRAPISETIIKMYAAEARLFRAWFFADKIQKFGKAKWVGKPLNIDSPELFAPRDSRDLVMDSVLADFDYAIQNLPPSWGDGEEPGRLNKYIALALKSRFCLFEGTFRKYHAGQFDPSFVGSSGTADFWLNEAVKAGEEIITSGKYQIYNTGDPSNDYNAFQRITDLRGNPEIIYWMEYDPAKGRNTNILTYYNLYQPGASKSIIDDYLCTDGSPIILNDGTYNPLYQGDKTIEDVFVNRDPRMRQTILHPQDAMKYDYFPENVVNNPLPWPTGIPGPLHSTTGYSLIKNWNRMQYQLGQYEAWFPAIMNRYAEVLLDFAEAKAELGTLTQGDLDISINVLRDRVNMPHLELNKVPIDPRYTDVSPLIAEIRRERRVEMFGEVGLRYFDLLRWSKGSLLSEPTLGLRWEDGGNKDRYTPEALAKMVLGTTTIHDPVTGENKTYLNPTKGTGYESPTFKEDRDYFWPLPLSVLTMNTDMHQNPQW